VRIPSLAQHLGPAPSYASIRTGSRGEEVVGYARSAGLYSIIIRTRGGWLSLKTPMAIHQENNALVRRSS